MRCLNCQTDNIALSAQNCPSCGMNLRTIWGNALPMGTLLHEGKYRIDWLLGRGGFGITYRATHTVLGRVVAIKEFFPRDFVHRNVGEAPVNVMPVSQTDYERGLERFMREGQVLSQIKEDHVVRVEDFFRDNHTAYLVMELLEGASLKTELRNAGGRLPQTRVLQITEDLVQALTVTHAQKVWHCDIKPDNVQILPSGRAVLIDFGAAHQGMASQSTRAFTRDYAAPELEAGKAVDARTDLFELGMVVHEMVTGRRPPMAVDRMMKDTWNGSHLRNPWKSWLPPLLQMRAEHRPESVQAWWKKRPKRVLPQVPVPVISPAPMSTAVPVGGGVPVGAPMPPSAPPLWVTHLPSPGGPTPQRIPPRLPKGQRPVDQQFRKAMIALAVITPLTVFLMMSLRILPVPHSSYSYSSSPSWSSTAKSQAVLSGPEQATRRLERVIREGQSESNFRYYISKGASVNKDDYRDSQGNALSPLLFAIKKYGDGTIVRQLVYKGAQVNASNSKGDTPLHYASRLGRVEAGEALLQTGAQVNVKDDNGWTPLHVCAKYGQQTMAKFLMSNQANVNAKSNYGGTPLHVAAYYGQLRVAQELLEHGADVNSKDGDGGTPLHTAAHFGKAQLADLLLEKQARVNEPSDDGDTPLHAAIREKQFDVVRLLLSKGADVNARNKDGDTPLHLMIRAGQQGLTQQILDKGADVNIANNDGETPLHLAARRDNAEIVKSLLDKGARVNAASNDGETPLHLAASQGQEGVAQLLLSRGADVNIVDRSGATPLQKAKGSAMSDLLQGGTPSEQPTADNSGNDNAASDEQ